MKTLGEQLQDVGISQMVPNSAWRELVPELQALETVARAGLSVVIKVDGVREDGSVFTVVISGGRLSDAFFRKDGPDLGELIRDALRFVIDRLMASK